MVFLGESYYSGNPTGILNEKLEESSGNPRENLTGILWESRGNTQGILEESSGKTRIILEEF